MQKTYIIENLDCANCAAELENALRTAFSPAADPQPDTADAPNDITLLVRRFTLAFASKIYVQKRVQFERQITLQ